MEKIGVTRRTHALLFEKVQQNYDELHAVHNEMRASSTDRSVRVNQYASELSREQSLQIILYKSKQTLKNSIIVHEPKKTDLIQLGSRVELEFPNKKVELILDGIAVSKDTCSICSPLGSQLLGKKAGDSLIVNANIVKIIKVF